MNEDIAGIARGLPTRFRAILVTLFIVLIAWCSLAHADDIDYAYDDAGRLVQAANLTSGQAVQYAYDAAGNITSQITTPITTLTIGSFSPRQGPVGTQVTVAGTGFSTTPASNAVAFNGVAASVLSATATKLVVVVPSGATSGTISVQVGANSVTSATAFTVTTFGTVPTISDVVPSVGTAGAMVTILGTNFEPTLAGNRVRFGDASAQVISATQTTIVTTVPATAASGKVRVTTPRGAAVSPMDFLVPPSGYSAGSIGSNGRVLTNGTPATVALSTANRISLQLFDATAGDLLSIGVTSTTVTSSTLKVFGPDGAQLASGTITANGQGLQIPKLTRTGTYTIVVDPGANTGTVTLSVLKPIQGTLTLGGSATNVSITPPGRRALLTFAGAQGTFASLSLTSVTLSAGTVTVFTPSGEQLISAPFTTAGLTIAPWLPTGGTYTVLIDPTGSVAGTLNVGLQSSASPNIAVNSTYSQALTNTSPVTLTFQATTGQFLSLAAVTNAQPIRGVSLVIRKPDGTQLTTGSMTANAVTGGYSGSVVVNMGPITQPGTYSVTVQQTTSVSGTLALSLTTPQSGTLTPNAGPTQANISTAGQGLLYNFSVAAGDVLAVAVIESPSDPGRINAASITILNPDGSALASGTLNTAFLTCSGSCVGTSGYYGSTVVNAGPARASGTYRVLLQQTGTGQADTGSLTVSLTKPTSTALVADAPTSSVSLANPGQGLFYTFSANAGDYRSFAISENSGQISGAVISVLAPDGSVIKTGAFAPNAAGGGFGGGGGYSGSAVVNIGPVPQTGTYTVLVQQTGGAGSTGTLVVTFSTPLAGTLTANSGTSAANLSAPGRALLYSFSGATGGYLSIAVAEDTQQINAAQITVLAPDGSTLATGPLATVAIPGTFGGIDGYSGTAVVNVGPLAASGTYSVLVQQTGANAADTGTLSLTLTSPLTGALTVAGATSNVSVSNAGQGVLYTFSGSAGSIYSLALSESNGNINSAKVTALKPDGSVLTTANFTPSPVSGPLGGTTGYTGGLVVNLGPLQTSGTYSVLVQQTGSGRANTGTLSLTLSQAVAGTLSGTANVSVTRPGQGILYTFAGTVGQFHRLQVSESYGSYISAGQITVLNPDGSALRSGAFSPTTCGGCDGYQGTATLNLDPLPLTGSYSVLVQQTAMPSSGTGTLTLSLNAITLTGSSSTNYSTTTAGQSVPMTMSATAGQSWGIALTNLSMTPSGTATIYLYRPDGSWYWQTTCSFGSATGCYIPFYRVPLTGNWTVTVAPPANATMSFTATLSTADAAQLTVGTPVTVNASLPGMGEMLHFTATQGQTYALRVYNVSTVPANQTVNINIYRGTSTNVYTSTTTTSGTTLNLSNLPADTYTVYLYPSVPITSSMQVLLQSGVTAVLPTDGTPSTLTTSVVGQSAYVSLPVVAGESYNLAFTNTSTVPANGSVNVAYYRPDGGSYWSTNCTFNGGNTCNIPMYRHPNTGTWTVVLTPAAGSTLSFNAVFTKSTGTALTPNTPVTANLTKPGQNGLYTFTATQGQTYALRVDGLSTVPAGQSMGINVYRGTSSATYTSTSTTSGTTINLSNLPEDTYSVLLVPNGTITSSVQLNLQAGSTAQLSTDGTPSALSTSVAGQSAYLSLPVVAGESYNLAILNTSTVPANGSVNVAYYRPDGGGYWSTNCTFNGSNACNIPMYRHPNTGTWTIVLTPPAGSTMSFNAVFTKSTGVSLDPNTPVNVNLPLAGQNGLYTFAATQGQTFALRVDNVATIPANQSMTVNVYRGTSSGAFASVSTTSGTTINLSNLGADTYSVLLVPNGTITSSMQLKLYSGAAALLATDGTPAPLSTSVSGQNAYVSFPIIAGETYDLAFTNTTTVPASGNVGIAYFRPDGGGYWSTTCTFTSNGCNIGSYRHPDTGTWTVELTPPANTTMSFNAIFTRAIATPLVQSTPVAVNLASPGQNGLYTFTATAGQTVSLQVSGVTTVPAGKSVTINVYRGTSTSLYTTASTTTGTTINLSNLPADTYSVLIGPNGGPYTSSMQLVYN